MAEEALNYLADIGEQASLRYAVQLLAPASEIAEAEKAKRAMKKHIESVKRLFVDVSKSVQHLKEFEEKMLK